MAEVVMGPQPEDAVSAFRGLSLQRRQTFEGWQMDGWVRWLAGLRGVYERRMASMSSILDEHAFQLKQSTPVRDQDADWGVISKTRILSFDWPRGGMFLWLRVHFEEHPLWQARGTAVPLLDGPALAKALFVFCTHKPWLVLAGPGSMFSATPEIDAEQGWRYYRLCFAAVAEEKIAPCAEMMGKAVQKFWRIKDVAEMEKLLDELNVAQAAAMEGVTDLGLGFGC
jgi:DNA-binding transcriptional MocR family regulator